MFGIPPFCTDMLMYTFSRLYNFSLLPITERNIFPSRFRSDTSLNWLISVEQWFLTNFFIVLTVALFHYLLINSLVQADLNSLKSFFNTPGYLCILCTGQHSDQRLISPWLSVQHMILSVDLVGVNLNVVLQHYPVN